MFIFIKNQVNTMEERIYYPTIEEIVEINKKLGERGTFINRGNLEFILDKVKNAKTFTRKAAILLYDIGRLHTFVEGNKRTGFHTMLYFLALNKRKFRYGYEDEEQIEKMLNRIGRNKESLYNIEKWIREGLI